MDKRKENWIINCGKQYKEKMVIDSMKKVVMIFAFIFMINFVIAGLSIPETFIGNVYYNNTLITGTHNIRVEVGGEDIGVAGQVVNGAYDIDVDPEMGISGKIYFFIGDIEALENGIYEFVFSNEINLDLNLKEKPEEESNCGNGDIELGEECDGLNLAGRTTTDCGAGFSGTIMCSNNCMINYFSCEAEVLNDNSGNGGSGGGNGGSGSNSYPTGEVEEPEEVFLEEKIFLTGEEESEKTEFSSTVTGAATGVIDNKKSIIAIGIFVMIVIVSLCLMVIKKKKDSSE